MIKLLYVKCRCLVPQPTGMLMLGESVNLTNLPRQPTINQSSCPVLGVYHFFQYLTHNLLQIFVVLRSCVSHAQLLLTTTL